MNANETRHSVAAKTAAMALVFLVAASALVCALPDASADGETYDIDLEQKYSMKVQFVFSGSSAGSISWNFGDGETSTEWNPLHEYAATGIYYGSQTVTNDYNGGSSDTMTFKIEVMGYPTITFVSNGGSSVSTVEQTAFNVVAAQPADPTLEGCTFAGWYTDEDLTNAMDWTSGIKKDITLYAAWDGEIPDPTPTPTPEPAKDDTVFAMSIFAIAGIVLLAAGLYTRHPIIAIAGIVLLGIAAAVHFEVFEWPF